MLSRRNFRIKVFQSIYAHTSLVEVEQEISRENIVKTFDYLTHQSEAFFVFLADLLNKYMVTLDKNNYDKFQNLIVKRQQKSDIFAKISNLPNFVTLTSHPFFVQLKKRHNKQYNVNNWMRNSHKKLLSQSKIQEWIQGDKITISNDDLITIATYILKYIVSKDNDFSEIVTKNFMTAFEDGYEMYQYIKNGLECPEKYFQDNSFCKQSKIEFARSLIDIYCEKKGYLSEIIAKTITKWSWQRVSKIDKILMRMAATEMFFMDSIPVNVSLDEYIDIAKDYNTHHSGKFINGILDNIKQNDIDFANHG